MSDDFQFDWTVHLKPCEPDTRLNYIDAVTGEPLEFAGEGWPTTDEEAELVLPRPPLRSRAALNLYYGYRADGQSIRDALVRVLLLI